MSVSTVIEVVIGLSFLYAVLSLIASGMQELIASVFRLRSLTLEQGIANMLADPSAVNQVFEHPIIQSLYRKTRLPSYIPHDKFALALLDSKVKAAVGGVDNAVASVTSTIQGLPAGRLQSTLDVLWRDANHDVDQFRHGVEDWYDSSMERVSGWYRRLAQAILLVLGLVVAVGLNVNTITVAQRLWTDAPLRAAVVQQAQKAAPPTATDPNSVKNALDNVQTGLKSVSGLAIPIGWGDATRPSLGGWYIALAGWLLTAVAIAMGAPFWFDVLGKAARLRSTGGRPPDAVPSSAETEPAVPGPAGR